MYMLSSLIHRKNLQTADHKFIICSKLQHQIINIIMFNIPGMLINAFLRSDMNF